MRKLTAGACVVAVLAIPLVAATGAVGAGTKFNLVKVTAKVQPKHINSGPYNWTESGTLIQPSKLCPFGPKFPQYCVPPAKQFCNGKMSLVVKLGKNKLLANSNKVIGTKTVTEKNCAYKIPISFDKSIFTATSPLKHASKFRHVHVIFYAKFLGNAIYNPASARQQVVVGKVLAP